MPTNRRPRRSSRPAAWLLLWLVSVLAQQAIAGPQLSVEPAVFELGRPERIPEGYPLTFRLTNTGDETLIITSVKTGCGCTEANVSEKSLAPGESTTLDARFKPKAFEGHIKKSIHIGTNNAKSPWTLATFKVFLPFSETGIRLWPAYAQVPVFKHRNDRLRAFVGVQNRNSDKKVIINKIDTPPGWELDTSPPVTIAPEQEAKIQVSRSIGDGKGFKDVPVTLHTDDPLAPLLKTRLEYKTRVK